MKPDCKLKENKECASGPDHSDSVETDSVSKAGRHSRLVALILFIVLSTAFSLYCAMITSNRFGDYGDDGIYVSAAKALATGQGYQIISLPQEAPQTQVPPFYPFLLSLIWRAQPQFPDSIVWMMLLSAIATLIFLALTYRYLTKQHYLTQWQALIVVALAGINWRTMLHGTSVMSEMVYAALSVGALYLAEKYEKEHNAYGTGIGAGVLIGLAFLTRSSGVVLLLAVPLYFVLRRQFRKAILPVGVAGIFVLSWVSWTSLNRTTAEGANAQYYSSYSSGITQTVADLQALNNTSRFKTILHVVGTNLLLLIIGAIPLACLGLRYDLPQVILVSFVLITVILIATGFMRQCFRSVRLLCIYLSLYLGILVLHPGIAYDRYIMPIVPFLLVFLVSELAAPVSVIRRELISGKYLLGKVTAAVIVIALLFAASVVIYSNASAIHQSLRSLTKISSVTSEHFEAIGWIKSHTDSSDVLVCNRDTIYYLYTGRKATPSFKLSMLDGIPYQTRQPEIDDISRTFLQIVTESKGQYLISSSDDFADISELYQMTIRQFIKQHPEKFVLLFESTNGNSIIYRIEGNSRQG